MCITISQKRGVNAFLKVESREESNKSDGKNYI